MKAKDIIKKYNLQNGWRDEVFNDLFNDFTSEFLALTEYYKADGNIKGLDQAIRVINMKYDSLKVKVIGLSSSGFWKKFTSEVINPISEQLCSEQLRRREEENRRQTERERRWEEEQKRWERSARQSLWDRLALMYLLLGDTPPYGAFTLLGLPSTATTEQIITSYRKLALEVHPDKGGSQEEFIKITEAKNKALKWAERLL